MKRHLVPLAALALLAAMAAHAAVPTRLLGDVVPANQATRTIPITAATRYVNVKRGETVRFVDNGRQFAYFFDGAAGQSSFDLRQVAPAGMLDHQVTAYIELDPQFWGP